MLTLLSLISFAAWVYLAVARGGFWRANTRLGDPAAPEAWPSVAIVIPARNESDSIGAVIAAHMEADYAGHFQVFLVDDQSDDGTATLAVAAARDDKLTVIKGKDLPDGWTGKLWAMKQGIEAASAMAPDYILFTDAEIVMSPSALSRLAAKAETEHLHLTSLMAKLDSRGIWGGLLIPAFVFFFQKLYPFPLSNDPNANVAAAAGGCMLVRTDTLRHIGGVDAICGELIDDCSLARKIKDSAPGARTWIGLSDGEAESLRDNRSFKSIWNMVARTAYAQLDYAPAMLFAALIGMAALYLAPPLISFSLFLHHNLLATLLALSAWGVMARLYWETLKIYDRRPWQAPLLPLAAAIYAGATFTSGLRSWRGEGAQWKGRSYDFGKPSE